MGVLAENLVWYLNYAAPHVMEGYYAGRSVHELGNQFLYIWEPPYTRYPKTFLAPSFDGPFPVAKKLFNLLGFTHVSIDQNGADEALPFDLGRPLAEQGATLEPADTVTDFGTSEHVKDLYECQRNIWNLCRVGGLIFQVNPEPQSWPNHGYHYRRVDFYHELTQNLESRLVDTQRLCACNNDTDGWNTWACYQRSDKPFMTREEFSQLPVSPS